MINTNKENVLMALLAFLVFVLLIMYAVETFTQADKERCTSMPFSEMVKDKSCDKYWKSE